MFLFWFRQLPRCGEQTPASVPPPTEVKSRPTNTPVFTPRSFVLSSFAWFYIVFSTGQVFLSTLSWCSACTSVSEGVFLMYLWREMNSTSTYSSAILFSQVLLCLFDYIYSYGCEVECYCDFDLHLPNKVNHLSYFITSHLYIFFGKMSIYLCIPFSQLKTGLFVLLLSCKSTFNIAH